MQTYAALGQKALHDVTPLFKCRPKLHVYHCEHVCRFADARLNPKWSSCWTEEDLVGCLSRLMKGSLHGANLARRVLERWLLHFNTSAQS